MYIKSFVNEFWQAALILPEDYRDYRSAERVVIGVGKNRLYRLKVTKGLSAPTWVGTAGKVALTRMLAMDAEGKIIGISFFGDTRPIRSIVKPGLTLHLYGSVEQNGGYLNMTNPEVIGFDKFGKVCPVYKGLKRIVSSERLAEKIEQAVQCMDEVVERIDAFMTEPESEVIRKTGLSHWTYRKIITSLHKPATPEEGWAAQVAARRLATYYAIKVANANADRTINPKAAIPVTTSLAKEMAGRFPYPLTDEQWTAVEGSIRSLAQPRQSLITYSADVGAGKTTIFGTVAAACAKAGVHVAIMAPNTILCEQIHNELSSIFPDICFSKAWGKEADLDPDARIHIGTTALISKAKKRQIEFSLVIVDEEHRFSRQQKHALMSAGSNYIASTATPIPRTMQLATMGAFDVYRITKTHVNKEIFTHILKRGDEGILHKYVRATLSHGYQVLIVLPVAQGSRKEKQTAEEAFEYWNSLYPGKVGLAHGKMDEEEKTRVIQKMRDGELSILCSTTVIEVGVTIPNARTMIIYHPETLGLAQLHQLRGRLARKGGKGHLLLYLPKDVKEKTLERLQALQRYADGFKLAEIDLRMRGFGDLSKDSDSQTGGMPSLIPNYEITVEDVEEIANFMEIGNASLTDLNDDPYTCHHSEKERARRCVAHHPGS